MNIFLAGAVEGYFDPLLDLAIGSEAHWIVCSGDFGIWPDPGRMDRASRKHHGADFAKKYIGADPRQVKVPILTIAGVHEDHRWLNHRKAVDNTEILNNVHWLAQGYRTTIGFEGLPCRVTGLGRAYSETTYSGERGKRSHRHYTRRDINRACASGPTDLLVVYEHLDAPGIRNVIFATRPKLILTAHHVNRPSYDNVQGIDVITLDRQEGKTVKWVEGKFTY